MKILVATGGSHGDVHPFIAVSRALQARGHDVLFCVHPHFRPDVAAAGLRHSPISEELDVLAEMRNPDIMHPVKGGLFVMDMIVRLTSDGVERVRALVREFRPDAILAHHIAIGAEWVAREGKVPIAVGVLAPMIWLSKRDPVAPFQRSRGWLGRLAGRAGGSLAWAVIGSRYDRAIGRLRAPLGLGLERRAFRRSFVAGDVNLGLWSTHFRAPMPDDPENGVVCGFPFYDGIAKSRSLDPGIERFLSEGDPPIVFSLGTAAVHVAGNFFEIAADACRRLERRGLLLVGHEGNVPRDLPAGVAAFGYAPFSLVLPRGAATVHHGGIGSTSQALRSGRPAVVVAHAHDQFHNALHVERLGAGRLLPRRRLDAGRLVRELRRVLDDPSCAAASTAIGEKLRAEEDGADRAAREVERIAAARLSAAAASTATPAR